MTSIMSPVLKARVDTCSVANNKYEVQNMSQPNEGQNVSQPNEAQKSANEIKTFSLSICARFVISKLFL